MIITKLYSQVNIEILMGTVFVYCRSVRGSGVWTKRAMHAAQQRGKVSVPNRLHGHTRRLRGHRRVSGGAVSRGGCLQQRAGKLLMSVSWWSNRRPLQRWLLPAQGT